MFILLEEVQHLLEDSYISKAIESYPTWGSAKAKKICMCRAALLNKNKIVLKVDLPHHHSIGFQYTHYKNICKCKIIAFQERKKKPTYPFGHGLLRRIKGRKSKPPCNVHSCSEQSASSQWCNHYAKLFSSQSETNQKISEVKKKPGWHPLFINLLLRNRNRGSNLPGSKCTDLIF